MIKVLVVLLSVAPYCASKAASISEREYVGDPVTRQSSAARKQLLAIRGEIVKIRRQANGILSITIKPAKEYVEATVIAGENDRVGVSVGRGEADIIGILTGDSREGETISAAELSEGDVVSVIYDPDRQNRAVELYIQG